MTGRVRPEAVRDSHGRQRRPFRKSVYEASGQYYVPVLVDGEMVLTETEEIVNYLDTYIANGHESGAASNLPPQLPG